ncbi:MAG: DUF3857 domain-containing protein, partial [Calditrichaeota bacterium]|nr:DUF3857 domain-containing protein [Calditrichota bacterium]
TIEEILPLKNEAEKYTDQDAVELYKAVRYALLPDGRREVQTTVVRLLRTYWAMDTYGDPEIPFDSVRQELIVSMSRTFMPNGKIVDTTPNGFNRITPDAVALAPDYTSLQNMVVTHLGLEPGAITYFDHTVRDRKPLGESFSGTALFGGRNPILWQELTIEVPAGTLLQVKEANGAPAAKKRTTTGVDRYFWRMDKLPAAWAPDAEPFASRFRPRVNFSNAASWDAALRPLTSAMAADTMVTPAMRRMIDEELSDEVSPESRVLAIQTYLRERFNRIEHAYPLFKRALRPAARVFESGYGHTLDLAILFAALARAAGLSADVALVFPNAPDVPGLDDFSEALMIVQTDGGERLFDVTKPPKECLRERLGDAQLLRLKPGTSLAPAPMPWVDQPTFSELLVTWNLKSDSSSSGEGVWRFGGALNHLGKMRDGKLENFLTGLLKSCWKGIVVENVRVRTMSPRESELAFDMRLPQAGDTAGGVRAFSLPDNKAYTNAVLPKNLNLAETKRPVPLFLRAAGEWHFKMHLEFPEGWKLLHLPSEVRAENGRGSFVQSIQAEKKVILVERHLRLHETTIFPEHWTDFQQIVQPAWNANVNTVVFE